MRNEEKYVEEIKENGFTYDKMTNAYQKSFGSMNYMYIHNTDDVPELHCTFSLEPYDEDNEEKILFLLEEIVRYQKYFRG